MGLKDVVGLDGTSRADGFTLLDLNVAFTGGALENSFAFLIWMFSCETLSPPIEEAVFGARFGMENPY